jgi:putative addiction module CopG family antidote
MNVTLKPKLKKFIENQVKSGRYSAAEDVVAAGLTRLMQDDKTDYGVARGELAILVAEGESDIAGGNTFTLDQVRKHFRRRAKSPK